jgi:hypothetical protein
MAVTRAIGSGPAECYGMVWMVSFDCRLLAVEVLSSSVAKTTLLTWVRNACI